MGEQFGSNRTKVLVWLYLAVGIVGIGLVLALVVSIGGYFIAGWESAPVSELVVWIVPACAALIVFKLLAVGSIKWDRRRDG